MDIDYIICDFTTREYEVLRQIEEKLSSEDKETANKWHRTVFNGKWHMSAEAERQQRLNPYQIPCDDELKMVSFGTFLIVEFRKLKSIISDWEHDCTMVDYHITVKAKGTNFDPVVIENAVLDVVTRAYQAFEDI